MAGLNKIMVIGNLGSDPEMRYTPNGAPVTSFSVATNRSYTTSQGERRDETEWFRIVAWNQLAETCNQFLKKGSSVYAEGRLRTDSWTSKDGEPRFTNEIIANQVVFLDKRGDNPVENEPINQQIPDNDNQSDNLPW
ncbi:MAG: single-stranded DNA-binding protein [Chloroflexi bacterium]|mgnify:CR=1 FL=1|nr:single-stranded DNA-binding protein [Chloroflexota bacterium]|tara:strand:+ start:74 stop:484 length:411 start_codon:yes stop_codon:yes gene_type:complete